MNQTPQINETQQGNTSQQTSQPIPNVEEAPKKEKKKKKKGGIIAIVVIILIAVAAICVFLWMNRTANKVADALKSGNIEDAVANYEDIEDDNDIERIQEQALAYAKQLQSDYLSEAEGAEYSVVSSKLEQLQSSILSEDEEIGVIIKQLEDINASRVAYTTAVKFKEAENYAEAIAQYNNVIEEDEKYYALVQSDLVGLMSLYRQDVLEEAKNYANNADYENALATLNSGLLVLEDDVELLSEITVIENTVQNSLVTELTDKINEAIRNVDFSQAMTLVKSGIKQYPDNAQLIYIQESIIEQYKEFQMALIDEYMVGRNVTEVLNILDDMQKFLPDDKEIPELIQYYSEKMPVLLTDIPVYKENSYSCQWGIAEEAVDTYANTYYNAFRLRTNYSTAKNRTTGYRGEIIYLNNEGYDHIAGTISYEKCKYPDGSAVLTIYADDTIVYTSPEITDRSEPVNFEVELGDCHEYSLFWTAGEKNKTLGQVIVSDVRLWMD